MRKKFVYFLTKLNIISIEAKISVDVRIFSGLYDPSCNIRPFSLFYLQKNNSFLVVLLLELHGFDHFQRVYFDDLKVAATFFQPFANILRRISAASINLVFAKHVVTL